MANTTETGEKRKIKSVEASLKILEYIHEQGAAGVTEIANEVELTKGTVYCHLNTLQEKRFIVREDDSYRIGLRFLGFGGKRVIQNKIHRFGKPEVDDLVEETGETVQICVEEQGKGIYIYQSRGEKAVQTDSYIGTERHLHATAFGKVILAYMSKERVEEILDSYGLPPVTEETITDRNELFDQLERIRERGIAFDDGEQIEGIRCVAGPVFGPDDEILGAISLSGPTKRISDDQYRQEVPHLIKQTARVIEITIANS
jgi:DNA-binding IclR family transcriptional regulator